MDKSENKRIPTGEISLDQICSAQSLDKLNQLLTKAMAGKKIQALIRDDNLNVVVKAVMGFVRNHDGRDKLLAAAILGRLAAVARSRGSHVLKQIPEIITKEPPSLDILSDKQLGNENKDSDLGKIKNYAAQSLRCLDTDWLPNYCLREAVNIDTSENARRELLNIALEKYGNTTEWINAIAVHADLLKPIVSYEARLKRVRRLFSAILEQLQQWQGELGDDPGESLEKLFTNFMREKSSDIENDLLFDILNCNLAMLLRLIELRFSIAFYAKTYTVIEKSKRIVGTGKWNDFLFKSNEIGNLRICLLEAALVLARQDQTDGGIIAVMTSAYSSHSQVCSAIKHHFKSALDLDPECSEWWHSAGNPSWSRHEVKHEFRNTEDEQIGALLIEVESSREAIKELEHTIVPLLEISDSVLASTVGKSIRGYSQIVQTVHRLAKMRKLGKTDLKDMVLQYNRSEHEMLGGHQSGVRRVKVIRDGITKMFGGRKKTLVKAWVEPAD